MDAAFVLSPAWAGWVDSCAVEGKESAKAEDSESLLVG